MLALDAESHRSVFLSMLVSHGESLGKVVSGYWRPIYAGLKLLESVMYPVRVVLPTFVAKRTAHFRPARSAPRAFLSGYNATSAARIGERGLAGIHAGRAS